MLVHVVTIGENKSQNTTPFLFSTEKAARNFFIGFLEQGDLSDDDILIAWKNKSFFDVDTIQYHTAILK